jgi:N-acetylmuramoyl-L-alanine amidase
MCVGKRACRLFRTIIFLIFGLSVSFGNGIKVSATPSETDNIPLILIDPGHGGGDSGAVSGNSIMEKHINLSISLKVRDRLKDLGYEVLMTREEDKDFYGKGSDVYMMKRRDLNYRCRMKRDSNCDFFISIHQNYFSDRNCEGAQVWYSRNNESKIFAHMLQENLKMDLGNNKREEKEAKDAYKILRCYTNIPSVILECGFLTNPEEEKKLLTDEYQSKVADSIVRSIKEYYEMSRD